MNRMAARQGGRWWYCKSPLDVLYNDSKPNFKLSAGMLFLILVFWIFVFRWLGFI